MKEKDRVQRVQARLWLEASHTLQRGGVQLGGRKAGKPTLLPPPSPLLSLDLSLHSTAPTNLVFVAHGGQPLCTDATHVAPRR